MRKFDVAVVGAADLVGETTVTLLQERDFPVGVLYALTTAEQAGGRLEFRNSYVHVQDVAHFDFAKVQLAFFHTSEENAARYVPKATAAGCVVIDNSAQFRLDEDVPLVVPEVNAHAIATYRGRGIIAAPNACAVFLAMVLKPLHDSVGISRVNVTTYQAVSGSGKAAVDELAAQTTSLFNLKGLVCEVYSKQIAFNVLPTIGACLPHHYSSEEMKLLWETRKLLADQMIGINATCVRVSVFYGYALAVHVETRHKLSASEVDTLLQRVPGIMILAGQETSDYPTPVTEAAGNDKVYVGRVREDITHPCGIDLWIVADNIRKGAALNSVQIAEILVKDYLN